VIGYPEDGGDKILRNIGILHYYTTSQPRRPRLENIFVCISINIPPIKEYLRVTPCQSNIGDYQCRFRRNRITIDQTFSIRQILEEKSEYNETVHQLLIDFKKAYDSVKREVLYNILLEFGIPKKLIKMRLNETYSKVRVDKHLSDTLPIQNGLK
jgi:hypothetical protein